MANKKIESINPRRNGCCVLALILAVVAIIMLSAIWITMPKRVCENKCDTYTIYWIEGEVNEIIHGDKIMCSGGLYVKDISSLNSIFFYNKRIFKITGHVNNNPLCLLKSCKTVCHIE